MCTTRLSQFLLLFRILDYEIFQVGPLRCWPGGLCLSRSIGDTDVGEFIVPIPHVKQVKASVPLIFNLGVDFWCFY